MSYFSRLSVECKETKADPISPSETQKLLERLEDLSIRREEIKRTCEKESWGLRDEDIRYVLAKDLKNLGDVDRAILLAESDLWKLLGISWGLYADEVRPEPAEVKPIVIPGQMTIDDYLKGTEKVA